MFLARLRGLRKEIRFRLTVVYSTLFGLFICIFAFILSNQYLESARANFDSALLNYGIDLANQSGSAASGLKSTIEIPQRESKKHFPFILKKMMYSIRTLEGEVLATRAGDTDITVIPYDRTLAEQEDYTHRFFNVIVRNKLYRAMNLKISDPVGREFIFQIATPMDIIDDLERKQLLINLVTIPLLLLLSSIASYFIAGAALDPVKNLIESVNSIAAQNLSHRVPVIDSRDEIGELSRTFNTILERLEKSFQAQEHFVANASHQLNTPLAIIKGELDVLESKSRSEDEVRKFKQSLREEINRLIEIVKDMLLISRVESGQESFIFTPQRIDEILLGIFSRFGLKAREKQITLRFNIADTAAEFDDFFVKGERQLLGCLFENLIDNALKYSPEGTVVSLEMKNETDSLVVGLRDEGPGIPKEDQEALFSQRFNRGENLLPGTGIGLKLARQIVNYHRGTLTYQALEPRGSLFIVTLPKQKS